MNDLNLKKWTEDVLGSMQGSKVVSPPRDLFSDIQRKIDPAEIRVLPFSQKIMGIAAAVLLLTLNVFTMNAYGVFENDHSKIVSDENPGDSALISDFKIYE